MSGKNITFSERLLRFVAFILMLNIFVIAFVTDKSIPFFAPPNLYVFGVLLSIVIFVYLHLQGRVNKSISIRKIHAPSLMFGMVIVLLSLFDLVYYGSTEWWLVYGGLFFILYYFAFSVLLPGINNLIVATKEFLYLLIALSLLLMVLELFQLIVLGASHDMLLNKAAAHYESTKSESNPLFLYRPLGLTGNYTINSALIVMAAQFLLMVDNQVGQRKRTAAAELLLVIVTIVGVLIAQSGTGYAMLAFFLAFYISEKLGLKVNMFVLSVVTVLSVFLLLLIGYWYDIYRITPGYFFHNYFIFVVDLGVFIDLSLLEMLFGTDPMLGLGHIDTGPSVMLLKIGLIGLVTYIFFFIYLYKRSRGRERVFLILFAIGSMRYPVIWNQVGQMMLALYLLLKPAIMRYSMTHSIAPLTINRK